MPLREFFRLLSCGRETPKVMFFDHVARQTEHFAPLVLPWPVEYLLAHHSTKHIFGGSRLPSLGTIGKALHRWEHKLRWQLVLGEQSRSPWSFLRSKQSDIRPCEVPLPPEVEEFFLKPNNVFIVKPCVSGTGRARTAASFPIFLVSFALLWIFYNMVRSWH